MVKSFEDVLAIVGELGRWQWSVILTSYLSGIMLIIQSFFLVFGGATPDHWCAIPQLKEANWTTEEIKRVAIPEEERNGHTVYSRCHMYTRNYTAVALEGINNGTSYITSDIIPCNERWDYDLTVFQSTIVTEWDLVCDKSVMLSAAQSWYIVGVLIGAFSFCVLSDKYGRQIMIKICSVSVVAFAGLTYFSNNYWMFVVLRILTGMSMQPLYILTLMLAIEVSAEKYRSKVSFICDTATALSRSFIGILAFYIRDWRPLLLSVSLISAVALIVVWIVPESPRWLLVKQRVEKADKELRRAAKMNKRDIGDTEQFNELLQSIAEAERQEQEKKSKQSFLKDINKSIHCTELRRRLLCIIPIWFNMGFVLYGIGFVFGRLKFNLFLTHVLNGTCILVTRIMLAIWPLPDYMGRRLFFLVCYIVGGVAIAAVSFVPDDMEVLPAILALTLSMTISNASTIIYQFASELTPTEVRNTAVGVGNLFSRFGGVLSPFVVLYLGNYNENIPYIVYGITSILSGLCVLQLPETKNMKMPDTIEELNEWRRNNRAKKNKKTNKEDAIDK